MWALRSVRVVCATLGLLLLPATAAWAVTSTDNLVPTANYDKWCQNADVCKTDNASVWYYMDSGGDNALESDDKEQVNIVIKYEYQPTDLTVSYDSTPTFSGDAETDWYITEATVSGDANGVAVCNDPDWWSYECDQHHITIEPGYWTPGLVCHELGHGVGLTHGDMASPKVDLEDPVLGCMKKPMGRYDDLGSNQVTRINNNY